MYTNDKTKNAMMRVVRITDNQQLPLQTILPFQQGFLVRDVWMHIAIRFLGKRFPEEIRHHIAQHFCMLYHLQTQDSIEIQLRWRDVPRTCTNDSNQFTSWQSLYRDNCI